ncbi:hypothetical protein [Plantactinospora sp. B24E8]|uniref:hypothetical protein n=1 Tax=Plantactinospora sp. B24E8 TaxID=3153567 RepID=UPI00325F6549
MPEGWSDPARTAGVAVEAVGDVLVLRGAADPLEPLVALATAVPAESGPAAVLSAPPVTGREDFFELVADLLVEHLGGSIGAVRLIALGGYAGSVEVVPAARRLAEWVGQEVLLPVSGLALAPDGCTLRPAGDPAEPTWVRCPPGGAPRPAAAWPPTGPSFAAPVESPVSPAAPAAPEPAPAVGAPARARSTGPGRWNWPAGGSWWLVRAAADAGLAVVPRTRPDVVWRPARPTAAAPRAEAAVTPPSTDLPGVRTRAGWSFLERPGNRNVAALAGFVVEVGVSVTGFQVLGRPQSPRALARMLASCHRDTRQPVVVVARGVTVSGAAADLLYGGLADALGVPVHAADAAVELSATGLLRTSGTFRRWSPRPVRVGDRRPPRQVRALGPVLPPLPVVVSGDARPVSGGVVLTFGAVTSAPRHAGATSGHPTSAPRPAEPVPPRTEPVVLGRAIVDLLDPERWRTLGATPVAEMSVLPGPVSPTALPGAGAGVATVVPAPAAGTATPAGPGADPAGPPEPTVDQVTGGTFVPESSIVAAGSTLPTAATLSGLSGLSGLSMSDELSEADGNGPGQVVPAPGPGTGGFVAASSVSPRWLSEADVETVVAQRPALRSAVGGRYDAHARVVTRTLAESPGLRATPGGLADLTAGLVAVRAYCDGERDLVNEVLRGAGPVEQVTRLGLLARWASYGLHRMPSVFGPVFRPGPAGSGYVAGYRPGDVLVEPAFVDVDLRPGRPPESGVEFAIWSISARRLAGLGAGTGTGGGLFASGSRFLVLAVDGPGDGAGPVRVFLRDLGALRSTPGRAVRDDPERILAQLRAVPRADDGATTDAAPSRFAPGLDDNGRPFPPPVESTGGAAGSGGEA